jgi:GDP/UDP-N,N'-diacetylbacillosamine 2-epimerase (hydrolysing)
MKLKRKIAVTTGTRAEYGILRPVLKKISSSKKLELCLIVTGMHLSQKHGMTIDEINKDGFKISAKMNMLPEGDSTFSMAKTVGEGIIEFSKIFKKLKPDINLILGDRDESLASAIAAYHMNIPNAHIHGGDKSKAGIDEYNRHAITKMSNIHFVATQKSRQRVLKMGENPKYVYLTGSPSIDEVLANEVTKKSELENKYDIHFTGKEILFLQHPVTTEIEQTERQIRNTLDAIVKIGNTTVAIAPNSDAGNKIIFEYLRKYSQKYPFIKTYQTLPRTDFLGMLKNCGVLVGNSSSGMIEASYFKIPIVNIGIRQEDRERGKNVFDVKISNVNLIQNAILSALKMNPNKLSIENVYGNGGASKKIVYYLENIKLDKKLIQKQISY